MDRNGGDRSGDRNWDRNGDRNGDRAIPQRHRRSASFSGPIDFADFADFAAGSPRAGCIGGGGILVNRSRSGSTVSDATPGDAVGGGGAAAAAAAADADADADADAAAAPDAAADAAEPSTPTALWMSGGSARDTAADIPPPANYAEPVRYRA
jgi:hypothetical protein